MSVISYDNNDDREVNNINYHEFDELVQEQTTVTNETNCSNSKIRNTNLILDHSAFVRGIGNIKRWFNRDYIKSNIKIKGDETINLNIFIPSYTLHEFDYVKKGTSMMATNAREAIRFIDSFFEKEENGNPQDDLHSKSQSILYNLFIESPTESGPSWKECLRYKIHTPRVKEFPNLKTKFDSNLIGQNPIFSKEENFDDASDISTNLYSSLSFKQTNQLNDIQYENSPSYQSALANSSKPAEMPIRLKYLIRSCIHKLYIEEKGARSSNTERWRLVTEDPITKIWATSFGIDCLNVNEAELLIFSNYDVNQFRNYNPNKDCSIDDDSNAISHNILQNTIDTTLYSYTKMEQPSADYNKKKKKKRIPKKIDGIVSTEGTRINGDIIKKERFDAINYAPRGKGELWKP